MSDERCDFSEESVRLAKDAELPQHGSAVVVDFLACKMVVGIKRVHTAKRQLYFFAGCGKSAPCPAMRPANHDFKDNRLFGDVTPQDLDLQVGKSGHELGVEAANFIPAHVVRVPGAILDTRHSRPKVPITPSRSCWFSNRTCCSTSAIRAASLDCGRGRVAMFTPKLNWLRLVANYLPVGRLCHGGQDHGEVR